MTCIHTSVTLRSLQRLLPVLQSRANDGDSRESPTEYHLMPFTAASIDLKLRSSTFGGSQTNRLATDEWANYARLTESSVQDSESESESETEAADHVGNILRGQGKEKKTIRIVEDPLNFSCQRPSILTGAETNHGGGRENVPKYP
jgi:hypothetical protein